VITNVECLLWGMLSCYQCAHRVEVSSRLGKGKRLTTVGIHAPPPSEHTTKRIRLRLAVAAAAAAATIAAAVFLRMPYRARFHRPRGLRNRKAAPAASSLPCAAQLTPPTRPRDSKVVPSRRGGRVVLVGGVKWADRSKGSRATRQRGGHGDGDSGRRPMATARTRPTASAMPLGLGSASDIGPYIWISYGFGFKKIADWGKRRRKKK